MASGLIKQKTYDRIHNTATLTSGTPFVVPADGYIRLMNNGVLSMLDYNGNYAGMAIARPGTGSTIFIPVSVKKGMTVKWDNDPGSSATCAFFMLE